MSNSASIALNSFIGSVIFWCSVTVCVMSLAVLHVYVRGYTDLWYFFLFMLKILNVWSTTYECYRLLAVCNAVFGVMRIAFAGCYLVKIC